MVKIRHFFLIFTAVFIVVSILIAGLAWYFLFTEKGSGFIVRFALSRCVKSENVAIDKIKGNVAQTIFLEGISTRDIEYLPPGSMLEAKKIDVKFNPFDPERSYINIVNGKLMLPHSDPVLFHGDYKDGALDVNIYSKSIDIGTLIGLWPRQSILKNAVGIVEDIDIYASGSLLEPRFKGSFLIKELKRSGFSLSGCHAELDLTIKDITGNAQVFGEIVFNNGRVSGEKTAIVNIQQSRILFNGAPDKPSLDIKGVSIVEDSKIDIALKGDVKNPDLRLSSDLPLPKERLFLRLATNMSWKGTEVAASQGQLSADMARDFIDYFFFSGAGSRLAGLLGLKSMSFLYNDKQKGVGVKKDISSNAEISYSIEQEQSKTDEVTGAQKVGGAYKLTDSVSVEAEREVKQESVKEKTQEEVQASDKVLLKYKKEF